MDYSGTKAGNPQTIRRSRGYRHSSLLSCVVKELKNQSYMGREFVWWFVEASGNILNCVHKNTKFDYCLQHSEVWSPHPWQRRTFHRTTHSWMNSRIDPFIGVQRHVSLLCVLGMCVRAVKFLSLFVVKKHWIELVLHSRNVTDSYLGRKNDTYLYWRWTAYSTAMLDIPT